MAMSYGHVYVASVAFGAKDTHTVQAFQEAVGYDGPSLIIAYSHCIAHGIELNSGLDQQYRAVASGHWPLVRYDPVARMTGQNPFLLDSPRPRMSLSDYRYRELRFRSLADSDPQESERLLELAEQANVRRWAVYEDMASRSAVDFPEDPRPARD
jgi:pyruvate-ferredoxin/flavodoxin oxidoreductase